MKSYIVYNIKSGEIIKTGACLDEYPLSIQTSSDNESVIEFNNDVDTFTGYILDNTVVYYTEEQQKIKKERPLYPARWSNQTFEWVDTRTADQIRIGLITSINFKRNKLLVDSDWTDTLSAKTRLGDELYNAWQTYRQALRDITLQPGFPFEIIWPTAPA